MPLIILDRDGVINYDSHAYIKSPDEWQAIPGSLEAISALNKAGFEVVIATNQSGIARGLYDQPMLEKIHAKLHAQLNTVGGQIRDIFFCPHHPDEGCICRKPQPGLFWQIREKYPLNFAQVFYVGDSLSDYQVAEKVGCKFLLVLTGNGKRTLTTLGPHAPLSYFSDLAAAAEFILDEHSSEI